MRDLKIDTNRASSSSRETFRIIGMFFLIGGTVLVGVNVLLGFIGRLGSR
ncbi:hypothetical protein [Micromonospora inositola]|nr:hypothetical protein [Micromonospora inositola]